MSRITRPLARRIDHLARRAHRFHRFAHHPLCAAYAGEVFRWGRYRICRGCALAGGGAVLGGVLGAAIPIHGLGCLAILATGLFVLGLAAIRATGVRRLGKLATRLLPSGMAGFLVVQSLRGLRPEGLLLAASVGAGFAWAVRSYRRRGPWRAPCRTCPERDSSPCPGFREQVRRERAFQRLAGRCLTMGALGDGAGADKMKPT